MADTVYTVKLDGNIVESGLDCNSAFILLDELLGNIKDEGKDCTIEMIVDIRSSEND